MSWLPFLKDNLAHPTPTHTQNIPPNTVYPCLQLPSAPPHPRTHTHHHHPPSILEKHPSGPVHACARALTQHEPAGWLQAKLLSCKFINARRYGLSSDAVECIHYCVNAGAKIISASWAYTSYSRSMYDAIVTANSRGVLFVSAAGNDAADLQVNASYPANYKLPNQIVVASTS